MTAPLPRGFVRLTSGGDPLLLPARLVFVAVDGMEGGVVVGVSGDHGFVSGKEHGPSLWHVRETFAEIQAALVAALGAQDGVYEGADLRTTIREIERIEATDAEIARLKHENAELAKNYEARGETIKEMLSLKSENERLTRERDAWRDQYDRDYKIAAKAAACRDALKAKLDYERSACDELAHRLFAPEWIRRSTVYAHKIRRAAEALNPEGGA